MLYLFLFVSAFLSGLWVGVNVEFYSLVVISAALCLSIYFPLRFLLRKAHPSENEPFKLAVMWSVMYIYCL